MATRSTQETVEVLAADSSSARVTQVTVEVLAAATSSARVTQETAEVLAQVLPNALLSQEALESLIRTNPNLRVSQEALEALIRTNPNPRVSQEALEVAIREISNLLVTQAPVEVAFSVNASMLVTQAPVEVILHIDRNIAVPLARSVGMRTNTPVVQVVGNALVTPVRPARAGAKTVPGPKWSVTVFGALAQATLIAPPVPDPSFDVRPGRKIMGARSHNPWLGPPFNAADSFANAVVIGADQVPYMVRGSTDGFTLEPGEPVPSSGLTGATGWYTFTAVTTGFYQFSLFNSEYNTTIAIYQQNGTGVAGLQEVGSNNDLGGTLSSNVFVYLIAGRQYWVQIGGAANQSGVFEFRIVPQSATCKPAQCGGSITANFWSGWCGSFSPSVVGGFGGFPEVARAPCPQNWTGVTAQLTLDSSSNPGAGWYVAFEIHDDRDGLLGGRGSFFGGPGAGITSWQIKSIVGAGGTAITGWNAASFGLNTARAAWFVIYAFPTSTQVLNGSMHAIATFGGSCPLPPDVIPPVTPVSGPSNIWWV